jgi:hypothetical protein
MIEDIALDSSQIEGEAVQVKFIPLSYIQKVSEVLWKRNAKKHDIRGILDSIERYGFIDPPKWDSNLNGGNGGLIYGNGRTEAIVSALLEAKSKGLEPPRGIPIAKESGEWCIPVKFGVDAESEHLAMAAAIDHNNLTMAGGDFELADFTKMWDEAGYLGVLSELADGELLPLTVDEETLGDLLLGDENTDSSEEDEQPKGEDQSNELKESFCVLVTCDDEQSQLELLEKLSEEGYKCRSLIS